MSPPDPPAGPQQPKPVDTGGQNRTAGESGTPDPNAAIGASAGPPPPADTVVGNGPPPGLADARPAPAPPGEISPPDPNATISAPPGPPQPADTVIGNGPPPGLAETRPAPPAPAVPAPPAPPETPAPSEPPDLDEETRRLLHLRLLMTVGPAACGCVALMIFGLISGHWRDHDVVTGGLVPSALVFAVTAGTALALRGHWSLSGLRRLELVYIGLISVLLAALRCWRFVELPSEVADEHRKLAVEHANANANAILYFLIFYYGLLIPNTRRRGLLVVAGMVVITMLPFPVAPLVNPQFAPYAAATGMNTLVASLVAGFGAVFGATRIDTLRREVYKARQLGAYVLKELLGKGGMGEVWLAEHRLLKRPCAVKFIRAEYAANPAAARRFAREVRAVTTLTHFNTVRVYDYGRADDGSFYYVMEYLDGPTLERLVKDSGPLEPGRAVYLLRQLCGALAEAHAAGMVHRDLKPGNVIVAELGGQRDVAKILDFGLVQDRYDETLTLDGAIMGTPSYMCPEQADGVSVDSRGDIYSLGAVAFFMLAGRPPFEADAVLKLLAAHRTQPAPDLRSLRADVPADLAAVVARCLAKDPKDRYPNADALAAALAACACAGAWSADVAARWWAERETATFGGGA